MDLEGNLILDRRPARRWVSALAVVMPVVACVAGVTWFVRTFIQPPTISIPGPLILASTAPAPLPAPPSRAEPAAARAESVWPAIIAPPTPTSPQASQYPQQAAAPTTGSPFPSAPQTTRVATTAFTDPARDNPAPAATPAAEAAAMPIAGRIPLPRPRPPVTALAAATAAPHAVPTPRTRPAEEEAAAASPTPGAGPALNAEPAYGRHSAE